MGLRETQAADFRLLITTHKYKTMKKHSVLAITDANVVPRDYVSIYATWPGLEGNNVRNWAFAGRFVHHPMQLVKTVGGRGGAIYVQRDEAAQMVLERRANLARREAIGAIAAIGTVEVEVAPAQKVAPAQGKLFFDVAPTLEDGTRELLSPGTPGNGQTLGTIAELIKHQNRTLSEVLAALRSLSKSFNDAWNTTGGRNDKNCMG